MPNTTNFLAPMFVSKKTTKLQSYRRNFQSNLEFFGIVSSGADIWFFGYPGPHDQNPRSVTDQGPIHDFGQGGSGVLTPGGPWAQNRGFSLKNAWKLILKKSWGQGGGWAPRAPWIRYCWLWLISCISNVFLTRRYSVEKHIFHVLMSFLESKW